MGFIKSFKTRGKSRMSGKGNEIILLSNEVPISKKTLKGLDISIKGTNNKVILHLPLKFINSKITINGHNNIIEIHESSKFIRNSNFLMDQKADRSLKIGKNILIAGADIIVALDKSQMTFGDGCMISYDVHIRNHDGHVIYDATTKEPIQQSAREMCIGNNVWIGFRSLITKNISIADGIIVAAGSIVSKSLEEQNTIFGGNPVRLLRQNVEWSHENVDHYLERIQKDF